MSGRSAASATAARVEAGHPVLDIRTRLVSLRLPLRLVSVSVMLLVIAAVLAVASLQVGEIALDPSQVIDALRGHGEPTAQRIVREWRAPVVLAAWVFGVLLGIGGAIFQSLTRNPLGSPDVIGFDAGSYTAVVVCLLVVGTGDSWSLATWALGGGLATAALVSVLAYRRGVQGFRLIIVGIGVSAMLSSLNSYLITRADIEDAMVVGFWGAGTLTRVTWSTLGPALCVGLLVVLGAATLTPMLRHLELGDDVATTLGTRPTPARLTLMGIGVAAVAMVTATAGPISFIALSAPQIARRLTPTAGISLLAAALTGGALLTTANLASLLISQAFEPLPVGLITVCVGGVYLCCLIFRETRRHSGAAL
ncbi:FecCD family ABC transporter permease [Brachybacterium paraconglomeratum]|uniref:FecCD family ABC transporter permease n=1 Tax=Brachybacterium paraconglomeratum TaxID=173362 RepID=UPI003FD10ACA